MINPAWTSFPVSYYTGVVDLYCCFPVAQGGGRSACTRLSYQALIIQVPLLYISTQNRPTSYSKTSTTAVLVVVVRAGYRIERKRSTCTPQVRAVRTQKQNTGCIDINSYRRANSAYIRSSRLTTSVMLNQAPWLEVGNKSMGTGPGVAPERHCCCCPAVSRTRTWSYTYLVQHEYQSTGIEYEY